MHNFLKSLEIEIYNQIDFKLIKNQFYSYEEEIKKIEKWVEFLKANKTKDIIILLFELK